jgi:hypothetical protein
MRPEAPPRFGFTPGVRIDLGCEYDVPAETPRGVREPVRQEDAHA